MSSFFGDAFRLLIMTIDAFENMTGLSSIPYPPRPSVFLVLIPVFVFGLYFSFRHTHTSILVTIFICVLSVTVLVFLIGFGIDDNIAVTFFFITTVPLFGIIGGIVGWALRYTFMRICRDRVGGKICEYLEN